MATKIGIYLTGLGQSIDNETVEKYMERLKNELSYTTTGFNYSLETKKITYQFEKDSTVVILNRRDKSGKEKVIYKMYDFQYHSILTDRFTKYNIFIKNLILFGLVLKKLPQIFLRIFNRNGFSRPYQTFYAFLILFSISLCVLFIVPVCIEFMTKDSFLDGILHNLNINITNFRLDNKTQILKLQNYGKLLLSITTMILLLAPQSKTIVTSLATEFACVDSYISNGEQSQLLLGNLDLLVEHIAENETEPELHIHSYSFGSILAIDALFPIAEIPPSKNIRNLTTLLITIGNPFEFIKAYYPKFYDERSDCMKDKLNWINIYSLKDVFATNFREDNQKGEAQFGIKNIDLLPENHNYEISSNKEISLLSVLSFHSIKMHKSYWDNSPLGQSCMRILLPTMLYKKQI